MGKYVQNTANWWIFYYNMCNYMQIYVNMLVNACKWGKYKQIGVNMCKVLHFSANSLILAHYCCKFANICGKLCIFTYF